jgi:hypothetical protein
MIRFNRVTLFGTLMAIFLAGTTLAGTYVSLNGGFHVTYPEDWYQVDYRTVDFYLSQGGSKRVIYNYEVALAPKASLQWNAGPYMMLTIDSIPNMTPKQIDSVLDNLAASVDRPVNKSHLGMTFDAGWRAMEVSYWPDQQVGAVAIEPAISQGDHTRTLVVLKFCPVGTANFYFYAPDSTWDMGKAAFAGIISSFSTAEVDKALPQETLKVADADRMKDEPTSNRTKYGLPISGGLVVILIVLIATRRRRRARRAQQKTPTE